jgi:MFS family permease
MLQATAAFLSRVIPTLAPAFTASYGWSETAVGYLAGLGTAGSIAFLVAGTPLIRRVGPVRALQAGLVLSALGTLLLAWPSLAAAALASVLIGIGYGPSSPAGSDVLQRFAPPAHRNLVFSIKQAGVPAGGVLAGILLPFVLERGGWAWTLAAVVAVACATMAAVQPLRARTDAWRDPAQSLKPAAIFALRNLTLPLSVLRTTPGLARLGLVGACLAVGQGAWFAFLITYLVLRLGLSLPAAGLVFAVMQGVGIPGRIALGWLADRLGSGRAVLAVTAAASAATTFALAATTPAWPPAALVALAGVAGVTVSSWNGLQVAEIARHAPPGLVGEAAAGATLLVFLGYVLGPALFAALVAATGRFDLAFAAAALVTLLALPGLLGRPKSPA